MKPNMNFRLNKIKNIEESKGKDYDYSNIELKNILIQCFTALNLNIINLNHDIRQLKENRVHSLNQSKINNFQNNNNQYIEINKGQMKQNINSQFNMKANEINNNNYGVDQNNLQRQGNLEKKVDNMSQKYSQLVNQIKKIRQLNQNKIEGRFQNVDIKLPTLNLQNQTLLTKILLKWFQDVCNKIFSVGFQLYDTNVLSLNKVKVYCSENILRNLIYFSQKYPLKQTHMKAINDYLIQKYLPYSRYKYPQTEEMGVNKHFESQLIQRNLIDSNESDQVYKSGVKFQINQDGNYNSEIMQFLNHVIQLTDNNVSLKEISKQSQNFNSMQMLKQNNKVKLNKKILSDLFFEDIQKIFQKVESQIQIGKMMEFNPKQIIYSNIEKKSKQLTQLKQSNEKQEINEEMKKKIIQYKQKVKSYTHYEIGRKLGKHIIKFAKNDIQNGNLNFNGSAIIRLVIKWCEELQKVFIDNYVTRRQFPFRMKDGSQKYFKKAQLQILNILLKRQWKIIQTKLQQIEQNNFKQQTYFINQSLKQQFQNIADCEAIVGQFSSAIFKTNGNYILNYLNLLIHGINNVLQKFQPIQRIYREMENQTGGQIFKTFSQFVRKSKFKEQDEQQIITKIQKSLKLFHDKPKALSQVPQLITFKVGDILRSKCSSKEKQITAIYRQLQRIHFQQPQLLRIVRVKNRLDKGNKDILMNLMYRNTLLVQIQLAIKSDKSKFIENSCSFSHYLYELQRADFGPIMEMSNIWISQDARANFYLDKMQKYNVRDKQNRKLKDCCKKKENKSQNSFPFVCNLCSCFYYDCNSSQKHTKCQQCQSYLCFRCQFEESTLEQKIKLIPQLNSLQNVKNQKINFSPTQLPQKIGLIFNLKSKYKTFKIFYKMIYHQNIYLFDISQYTNEKPYFKLITTLSRDNLAQKQLKNSLILTNQQLFNKQFKKIPQQFFVDNFFIPKNIENCIKNQNKTLIIVNEKLNQKIFQNYNKGLEFVQQINFSGNSFRSIQKLPIQFPNITTIILNNNKIQNIGSQNLKLWENIKILHINMNQIRNISQISSNLKQLQEIDLSLNQIYEIPESFGDLYNLRSLIIYRNRIKQIPQSFSKLINLTYLNISQNKLQQIPQIFCNLINLSAFIASYNNLQELPKDFGNLKKLVNLEIVKNSIEQLPQSFSKLQKLQNLFMKMNPFNQFSKALYSCLSLKKITMQSTYIKNISQITNLKSLLNLQINLSSIQQLPQDLGELKYLRSIILFGNTLIKLPDSICKLQNLKILILKRNSLSELPKQIGSLTQLQQFDLSQNQLIKLPQSIGELSKLKILRLCYNSLKQLPNTIGKLTNIKTLQLQYNQLQKLPQQFGNLILLTQLILIQNNLIQLPHSIGNMINLKNININKNKLKHLPIQLYNIIGITILNISYNQIQELSQQIKNLTQLYTLFAQSNKLKSLPQNIKYLKKLRQLYLSKNPLQKLQQVIFKLSSLYTLQILIDQKLEFPHVIPDMPLLWQIKINKQLQPDIQKWIKQQCFPKLSSINQVNKYEQ